MTTLPAPARELLAEPSVVLLLALADDELVLGHRHSHWTGVAPHMEEDLAFSSISQDEIGHAVVWYELAAARTGADPDRLALGREPGEYRHAELCERENGDWGFTTARHLCYDLAEEIRLATLADSTDLDIAQASAPLRREERLHLVHARAWLTRLAGGSPAARARLVAGLEEAIPLAAGLFEPLDGEAELCSSGLLPAPHSDQFARWREALVAELAPLDLAGLIPDALAPPEAGGRQGLHSPLWPEVWDEMTRMHRDDPTARW